MAMISTDAIAKGSGGEDARVVEPMSVVAAALHRTLKLKQMFFKIPKLRHWVLPFRSMLLLLTVAMLAACLLVVCEMCIVVENSALWIMVSRILIC
jgi:hypothetical protein